MEGLNEDQGGVEVSNGRAKPCYPVLVCVDGLISSGKSTLLSNLKEKGFITYPEPLSEWKGQLERFYANPKKEFLNTQSFILDSQIKLKEKLVQNHSEVRLRTSSCSSSALPLEPRGRPLRYWSAYLF